VPFKIIECCNQASTILNLFLIFTVVFTTDILELQTLLQNSIFIYSTG
jgi:hypothetical protein